MTAGPTAHRSGELVPAELGEGHRRGRPEAQAQWGRALGWSVEAETRMTAGLCGPSGVPGAVPALRPFLIGALPPSYGFSKTKACGHLLCAGPARVTSGTNGHQSEESAECRFLGPQTSSRASRGSALCTGRKSRPPRSPSSEHPARPGTAPHGPALVSSSAHLDPAAEL